MSVVLGCLCTVGERNEISGSRESRRLVELLSAAGFLWCNAEGCGKILLACCFVHFGSVYHCLRVFLFGMTAISKDVTRNFKTFIFKLPWHACSLCRRAFVFFSRKMWNLVCCRNDQVVFFFFFFLDLDTGRMLTQSFSCLHFGKIWSSPTLKMGDPLNSFFVEVGWIGCGVGGCA